MQHGGGCDLVSVHPAVDTRDAQNLYSRKLRRRRSRTEAVNEYTNYSPDNGGVSLWNTQMGGHIS
jgi:hypothetical protein